MSNKIKIISVVLAFFSILLVPSLVFAQATQTQQSPVTQTQTSPTTQTQQSPNAITTIQNPLKYNSIQAIVGALLQAVEYIGGIVCALYIIWAGFLFVKAQGNQTELEGAKKTITHALIGTAIVLGASVILNIVTTTINAIKS